MRLSLKHDSILLELILQLTAVGTCCYTAKNDLTMPRWLTKLSWRCASKSVRWIWETPPFAVFSGCVAKHPRPEFVVSTIYNRCSEAFQCESRKYMTMLCVEALSYCVMLSGEHKFVVDGLSCTAMSAMSCSIGAGVVPCLAINRLQSFGSGVSFRL